MHIEIQVALNFVISYLYNKLPRRRVNIFGEELEKALKDKFQGHWYPDKPFKGSAYRCLKTGDPIDRVLERAARESGVPIQDILENLPQELAVWVDPGEVSYRIGEKGAVKVLFSDKIDPLEDHCADREVTKTFNPEAQCFRPIESVGCSLSNLTLSPKPYVNGVVVAPGGGGIGTIIPAQTGQSMASIPASMAAVAAAALASVQQHQQLQHQQQQLLPPPPQQQLPPPQQQQQQQQQQQHQQQQQVASVANVNVQLPNGVQVGGQGQLLNGHRSPVTTSPTGSQISAPSASQTQVNLKGSPSPIPPPVVPAFISRSTAPLTFTTATFAQTKFGSTKLKTSSKRANRMSPTEFSNYIKQRALQQQIHHQQQHVAVAAAAAAAAAQHHQAPAPIIPHALSAATQSSQQRSLSPQTSHQVITSDLHHPPGSHSHHHHHHSHHQQQQAATAAATAAAAAAAAAAAYYFPPASANNSTMNGGQCMNGNGNVIGTGRDGGGVATSITSAAHHFAHYGGARTIFDNAANPFSNQFVTRNDLYGPKLTPSFGEHFSNGIQFNSNSMNSGNTQQTSISASPGVIGQGQLSQNTTQSLGAIIGNATNNTKTIIENNATMPNSSIGAQENSNKSPPIPAPSSSSSSSSASSIADGWSYTPPATGQYQHLLVAN